jgi:DNA-binding GntR family transcriptional regulator
VTVMTKSSMDDIVYNKLKQAILFKRFPPNYKLVESDLSKMMNVSRTPVRTAFKLLKKDGLLNIIPNKGTYIAKQTYKDIKDSFLIRVELEKTSVRYACPKITNKDLKRIEAILVDERAAYKANNRMEAYKLGAEFHKTIAKITENLTLIRFVEEIIVKTDVYDIFYILNDPKLENKYLSPDQHYEIFKALSLRDIPLAEKTMEEHLNYNSSQLLVLTNDDIDLEGLLKIDLE